MTTTRLELPLRGNMRLVADVRGDGPPVVLLHGGGQTRHSWGGTADTLAREGFRAISVDHRGHGESSWAPDGNYRLEEFAEDLREIVRELGEPPFVVGASLGGLTAILAEGESAGDLTRAVVLVDIVPRMNPEGVERIIGFMSAYPDGFASLEEAADAIARYIPHRPRPKDMSGLEKNLRLHDDGRYRWHWDPRFIRRTWGRDAHQFLERLESAARRIRVPLLLVRGRLSEVISEEAAHEFLELVPHAKYADVGKARHMVAGDRNDAFTDAVVGFLRELS